MNHPFAAPFLLHGGDYNPEQWLDAPEILEKDLEYFEKTGINTVTLGIFSWAALEPEEGCFQMQWLEDVISRVWDRGIHVILATPSGARPKWLADRYPEVLRTDASRRRALFGGRHNHCYTSPIYREKVRRIDQELARRFGSHPAVLLWHVSNEYGGECHCPLCQERFRGWLKERYGTIERLNHQWNTAFWSHTYQDFSQVESPSPLGEHALHGLNLDWKRFVTHCTADFLDWEVKALREGGSRLPVTANFMYDYTGLNYGKFRSSLDVVSWDNYPTWHKGPEADTAADCGFQHDRMRSLLGRPFLLMESSPSSTNWQPVSKLRKPGILELASLQAVAHGSDSVLYFQLRQSRGASEKFHGAVIDHYGGPDTRILKETAQVGQALSRLREVAGSPVPKQTAILWDMESRWAMEDAQGPRNQGLPHKETAMGMYRALRSLGLSVDILDMEDSLEGYRLIAAPMQYLFREGIQQKLEAFVREGGVLVMTFWSGVVDENDLCFLGPTPGGLTDVLGLRFCEIDGLYDWESNRMVPVSPAGEEPGGVSFAHSYRCSQLCERILPSSARTVMTYGEDFYAGEPVLTCNAWGKGQAWYLAAAAEPDFYRDFFTQLAAPLFPERPVSDLPEGVEACLRENDAYQYLFLQNFHREPAAVSLSRAGSDPETEWTCVFGSFHGVLDGWSTAVLRRKRRPS